MLLVGSMGWPRLVGHQVWVDSVPQVPSLDNTKTPPVVPLASSIPWGNCDVEF